MKVKVKLLSRVQLCDPMDCSLQAPPSMGFYRQQYWSGLPFPSPGNLPDPGIEPRSPALQVDSLPAEPQGKPKNTGVGSLSLLQQIFLTQELNRGLLNCRQILYQVRYQGSPKWHVASPLGNQIPVSHVTEWDTHHYINEEQFIT